MEATGCGMISLKYWKRVNCQSRFIFKAKISFKSESEMKTFLDRKKREFVKSRNVLKKY